MCAKAVGRISPTAFFIRGRSEARCHESSFGQAAFDLEVIAYKVQVMNGPTRCSRIFLTAALLISLLAPLVFSQNASTSYQPKNYEFVNGQWFDGTRYRSETFYSVDGILTKRKPRGSFERVDLANEFVIPPFAEAHNHNLGSAIYLRRDSIQQMIQRYLAAGVFYVKIPGNPAENAAILRGEFVNRPDSVDVTFANGVLTSKDGHPIGMTQDSFKQAGIAVPSVEDLEARGVFFIIESEADLRSKWEKIMSGKPDFIKTILRHSENFAQRRTASERFGYNGLDPQLLPSIVKLAHAAGLRVSTHIDSAADFAVAVRAGVDEINHLPGAIFEKGTSEADYLIKPDVARLAAKKGIVVVTTTNIAPLFAKGEALTKVQAVQRQNLRLLKKYGVRMAVGSDNYTDTSLEEALYLKSLDVFDNRDLLKMWCTESAQTIFPQRKIGYLREGFEASFLVLSSDPVANFNSVIGIKMKFKQGRPLPPS